MGKSLLAAGLGGLISIAAATSTKAAEILDQSMVFPPAPSSVNMHAIDVNFDVAQTFKVGVGGQLTHVDLEIARYASASLPLQIDVRQVLAGGTPVEPDAPVLASISLNPPSVPQFALSFPYSGSFTSIDLSSFNIPVAPGDVFAIVLQSAEPHQTGSRGYLWHMADQFTNPYSNGTLFERTATFTTWTARFDNVDAAFRTYVTTPEPSFALVGLAIGAMSLRRYRHT